MKPFLAVLLLSFACVAQTSGLYPPQSTTFTFDQTTAITSYNGSDPANPPYPDDMGSVNLSNPNPGIDVPWQLSYLNNGYLQPCDPLQWGAKVWILGDGTHAGDKYTLSAVTSCPYFTGEYGSYGDSTNILDGFSVTATYVRSFVRSCGRYNICHTFPVDKLQGGTGEVTQTLINP
jgi:hypothetical protein